MTEITTPLRTRAVRTASLVFSLLTCAIACLAPAAVAQQKVTSPKEFFGFAIGDDYRLANYSRFVEYWRKLDAESDRMIVQEIGKSAEGRAQLMAIVTSPRNHKDLARYKTIAARLARAEGLTDAEAKRLAAEGKTVVWIDGGLHATEVLGAHQLIETTYRLVQSDTPEVRRFLDDCVILLVHANPDGMELVSDWYMREPDEKKRSYRNIPRLYQKYIGHDNNRDFYMGTQAETQNMLRIQFQEWFPQIVYNHHQTGPAGAVLFAPPFRAPHNHHFDPLIVTGIDLVGTAMHQRFVQEDKPGAVRRSQAGYQTWWNGGLRTTTYFHNMIGLLTETIGSPTPMEIPFTPDKLVPQEDYVFPITPQPWHFRQSVEYSVTANFAVLDVASRYREQFLYNIYKMGRNSIEKGNRDTWTDYPKRIEMVKEAIRGERSGGSSESASLGTVQPSRYFSLLRDPKLRDPRGYILPADQPDFPTAVKFVQTLQRNGITVHRATRAFSVGGKSYPAGSFVVKTAQAFRPHILDMFEPQDYPNDLQYPGGPPKPPYDSAGYTLAYQMGVRFDRVLEGFDFPAEKIEGMAKVPAGTVTPGRAGWLVDHAYNDAFTVINRVLKAGGEVRWLMENTTVDGKSVGAGAWFIASGDGAKAVVETAAAELGVSFTGVDTGPDAGMPLKAVRIGLWDRYGGSMPSGWTRWLFEQFEFPFQVVYPQELDNGNQRAKFDVLVFVDGAIPERDPRGGDSGTDDADVPAEYRSWLGRVSVAKTVPQLKTFLEQGGTIITIGTSTRLAEHLNLPVQNHLTRMGADGEARALERDEFFVPGSVLQVATDPTHPLAHGIPAQVDVFFDNSPVFRLEPEALTTGNIRPIAWFDSAQPLRSGWAWGQGYLKEGIVAAEARVGRGHLFLLGPEVANRAQPHGTFKFLFNGIYYGPASAK
ncbi:MAG: M14 family metallopeptidase [Armatimonadaceae bacterium]